MKKKFERIGNFNVLVHRSFASCVKSALLPALLFVFAFFIFATAGIRMGNPVLYGSFVDGGEQTSNGIVLNIDGDELLRKAEAAGSASVSVTGEGYYTNGGSYSGSDSSSTDIPGAFANDYNAATSATVNVSYGNATKAQDLYAGGCVNISVSGSAHIEPSGSSGGGLKIATNDAYLQVNGSNVAIQNWNNQTSGGTHVWYTPSYSQNGYKTKVNSVYMYAKGWTIHDTSVFHKTKYGKLTVSVSVTITISDGSDPSVSLHTDTTGSAWAKQKQVYFNVSDNGAASANMPVSTNFGASHSGSGNKWYTTSNVTGPLTVKAIDHVKRKNNGDSGTTFTTYAMKIDRTAPKIDSVKFYKMTSDSAYDTAQEVTSNYNGKVAMVVTASDIGSVSGNTESGVASIAVTNGRGYSPAAVQNSNTAVFLNVPNGKYTVTVTDKVTWSTQGTYYMYYIDTKAPTISLTLSKATSPTVYAKGPVTATFTIVDSGGGGNNYSASNEQGIASDIGTNYQNARVGSKFVVTDRVKNKSTTIMLTSSNGSYSNGTWTYTCTVSLYYSTGGATGRSYIFTATDSAGNTTSSATYSGNSISEIHTYIDTTAPTITSVEAHPYLNGSSGNVDTAVDAKKDWTKNVVQLKVYIGDTAVANGMSYCKKVELFKGTSATGTAYASVDNLDSSDALVTFNVTDDWITTKNYYIRLTDYAGNTSDMSNGSVTVPYTNASGGAASVTDNTYYSNSNLSGSNRTLRVNKDSVIPTVSIYSAQDTSSTLFASSSPNKAYTKEWTINDVTYYVCVTFGPSGGILYESVNGATATVVNTYNHYAAIPANNTEWNSRTKNQEGIKNYVYTFTSNTGIDYVCGTFTTRIDKTGPTLTLLGFGTGFTGTPTEEEVKNYPSNYIGGYKSLTYLTDNWLYSDGLTAFVLIKDSDSGPSGDTVEYGDPTTFGSNSSSKQTSNTYGYVYFSHNGYTANYTKYYTGTSTNKNYIHPTKYGDVYILAIQLYRTSGNNFSNNLMRSAMNGANSIVSGNTLDLAYGKNQTFDYKIKITDFVGNERVLDVGGNTTLSYKVDPFMPNGYVSSVVTRSDGASYDYSVAGRSWTKDGIEITIAKSQMGLSETKVKYAFYDVMDQSNGTTVGYYNTNPIAADSLFYNYVPDGNWNSIAGITADADSDSATSTTAKIRLGNNNSRCQKFFFKIYTKATEKALDNDQSGNIIILRQDVDAPVVTAVFMSTDNSIAAIPDPKASNSYYLDSRILLYYEFVESSGSYTVNRRYTHIADETVWTNKKVYLYVVASDYNGVGLGSGINRMVINISTTNETVTVSNLKQSQTEDPYKYMYCTANTFGYTALNDEYGIALQIFDNQNNNNTISKEKDSANHKLFPVVDGKVPVVSISAATYSSVNNYLNNSNKLSGNKIKESLDIEFTYNVGISGAAIYVRQRQFQTILDNNDPVYSNSSVPGNNPTYGFYTKAGIDLDEEDENGKKIWMEVPVAGRTTAGDGDGLTWSYQISNAGHVSIRNRYDVIIINGAGVYYYFDGGDVFIDTAPPEFVSVFYALASDPDNAGVNGVIDKSQLTTLSLSDWTNDSIYVYYYVTDAASGVDRVVYSTATGDTNLEKVSVKVSNTETTPGGTKGDGYYRMLLDSKKDYYVIAYDEAENPGQSATVQPCIDKNPITLNVTLSAGGASYTSGAWTNKNNVVVALSYSSGGSGFSYIEYCCVGYDEDPHDWTTLVSDSGGQSYNYEFIVNGEGRAKYYFRAYNGVTGDYAKFVNGNQPRPFGVYGEGDTGSAQVIAIDRVVPNIDPSYGNADFLAGTWHNDPRALLIGISDVNGSHDVSGVETVAINYTVGSQNQPTQYMSASSTEGNWTVYTSGSFTLTHYVYYYVTVTDAAGNTNSSDPYRLLPKVDTYEPEFKNLVGILDGDDNPITYKLYNNDATDYTAGSGNTINWTSQDVLAYFNVGYSISGAKLLYSVDGEEYLLNSGSNTLWDLSFDWNNPTIADDGKTNTSGNVSITFRPGSSQSLSHTYALKLVSGSGTVSSVAIELGKISIDQVTPSLTVSFQKPGGNDIAGSWTGTTFSMSEWISTNAIVKATCSDTLVSGYTVYYNTSQGAADWQAVSGSSDIGNATSTIQLRSQQKEFYHRLSQAVNNYKYEYYIESGSGLRSPTYTIKDVKIDNTSVGLNLSAVCGTVDTAPSAGKFATTTSGNFVNKPGYNLNGSAWANSNSIVIKAEIPSVNISGVTIKIKDKSVSDNFVEYETLNYNNGRGATRYYVIPYTTEIEITVVSGAGSSALSRGIIKLDNAIPALFVKSVTGNKSSNWDDNDADSCWYTGNVKINLGVGTFVKNGNTYDLVERAIVNNEEINVPVSGYKIEYAINGGEWQDNGTSTEIGLSGVMQNSYSFRITSTAGMEYIVGNAVYNNVGARALSAAEIKTRVVSAGGLANHLSDNDFEYIVYVDTNQYDIIAEQMVTLVNNNQTINVTAVYYGAIEFYFATYSYEIKIDGNWVPVGDGYRFHRGDLIRIKYVSNTADNYVHRKTDYGKFDTETNDWKVDGSGNYVDKNTYSGAAHELEDGDDFTYRFSDSSLTVNAYYIKKLTVEYSDLVLYKQSQSEGGVTASATYSYYIRRSEGAAPNLVNMNVPLSIRYEDLSGNEVDPNTLDLGAYLIDVSVVGENAGSFRLTNGNTLYLVKYFTETFDNGGNVIPNSEGTPYAINNETDLAHVSMSYNYKTSYDDATVYVHNYLNDSYRLTDDLVINDTVAVSDVFGGTFDGQGHTVTMTGTLCEGNGSVAKFGFFTGFNGKAYNMTIRYSNVLQVKGYVVGGIFAATMSTDAEAYNVAVEGSIDIDSGNTGVLKIGGFTGSLEGGKIGGTSINNDKLVYVDVSIVNKGAAISSGAYIGGVAGYVEDGSKIFGSYVNAHVVVYRVSAGEVKVGALFGGAETTSFVGDTASDYYFNNHYVPHNVFLNDVMTTGFAGVSNNINDTNETANTVSAVSYDLMTDINNVGGFAVAAKTIKNRILDKIYSDFGLTPVDSLYTDGIGTDSDPLVIDNVDKLRLIDRYPILSYELIADLDLSEFGEAIALHEVYTGTFDGSGHKLSYFGYDFDIADGDRVGLFAELNGEVKNVVLYDVKLAVDVDLATVYAGAVAAKAYGSVSDVIVVGTTKVMSTGTVYIGSLAGYLSATVTDYFSINNIYGSGATVYAGGVTGQASASTLNTVFSLGRVEANSDSPYVGGVYGDGLVSNASSLYFITDNTYVNGIISNFSDIGSDVDLDNITMRNTTFTGGTNVFNKVFVSDGLYYLEGSGISSDKFIVEDADDFAYIDHMLYATYNVKNDITFTSFTTIGKGLTFTGAIDGKNADSWNAQDGTVSTLKNVTDALVYKNSGRITDLGINVNFTKVLSAGENVVFGAVAIYNVSGTIRNVTVDGSISITATQTSTVTASGFVGESDGGTITGDSKVQNSISGLNITIENANTVYAGGYVGVINGSMTLSYGIGSGQLIISDSNHVFAGTLVGRANRTCDWSSLDETAEYRYEVAVNGTPVTDLFGYYPA